VGASADRVREANLLIKFLLELVALAALAVWGANTGHGWLPVVLASVTPLAAALLWGVFAAPTSGRRLPPPARVPFELLVFASAVAALAAAGWIEPSLVFAALVLVNSALLTAFGQWDR
jgi:Protein of unknown function (DUF2568)